MESSGESGFLSNGGRGLSPLTRAGVRYPFCKSRLSAFVTCRGIFFGEKGLSGMPEVRGLRVTGHVMERPEGCCAPVPKKVPAWSLALMFGTMEYGAVERGAPADRLC